MPNRFLKTLSFRSSLEWILNRPLVIVACFAAVSIFFALQIPKLAFRTSIYELLIDNLSETIRYADSKKVFGSDEIIQVVVKADDILDAVAFRKIEALSETFGTIPGVRRVISLPAIKKKVDPGGNWTIERSDNSWEWAVSNGDDAATATVAMEPETAWKLMSKSLHGEDARAHLVMDGDETLAMPLARLVSVMA